MIIKCVTNPDDCHHKRGGWWKHHGEENHGNWDMKLDEPVSREEFIIYDILKSSTLIMFFLYLIVFIMGKAAQCAVKVQKAFVVKKIFKKSLCMMIPILILTCIMGKHCKHMHRVIEKIKHDHNVTTTTSEEYRGRNLQESPFVEMEKFMNEAERDMNRLMNDPKFEQ